MQEEKKGEKSRTRDFEFFQTRTVQAFIETKVNATVNPVYESKVFVFVSRHFVWHDIDAGVLVSLCTCMLLLGLVAVGCCMAKRRRLHHAIHTLKDEERFWLLNSGLAVVTERHTQQLLVCCSEQPVHPISVTALASKNIIEVWSIQQMHQTMHCRVQRSNWWNTDKHTSRSVIAS